MDVAKELTEKPAVAATATPAFGQQDAVPHTRPFPTPCLTPVPHTIRSSPFLARPPSIPLPSPSHPLSSPIPFSCFTPHPPVLPLPFPFFLPQPGLSPLPFPPADNRPAGRPNGQPTGSLQRDCSLLFGLRGIIARGTPRTGLEGKQSRRQWGVANPSGRKFHSRPGRTPSAPRNAGRSGSSATTKIASTSPMSSPTTSTPLIGSMAAAVPLIVPAGPARRARTARRTHGASPTRRPAQLLLRPVLTHGRPTHIPTDSSSSLAAGRPGPGRPPANGSRRPAGPRRPRAHLLLLVVLLLHLITPPFSFAGSDTHPVGRLHLLLGDASGWAGRGDAGAGAAGRGDDGRSAAGHGIGNAAAG